MGQPIPARHQMQWCAINFSPRSLSQFVYDENQPVRKFSRFETSVFKLGPVQTCKTGQKTIQTFKIWIYNRHQYKK